MKAHVMMSNNQCVPLEHLRTIEVPASTDTYAPVPHAEVIDVLLAESATLGMRVLDSKYAVTKNGNRMFASLTLSGSDTGVYEWSLVAINSYDKSTALKLGGGLRTIVCCNLSLSAEYEYHHKHTKGVSLDEGAKRVLGGLPSYCTHLEQEMEALKAVPISRQEGTHFVVEWGRSVNLSGGDIYRILDLWQDPLHEAFKPYTDYVYGLYQAVTTRAGGWGDGKKYPALTSLDKAVRGWSWN